MCEFSIHPPLRTVDQIVAAASEADVLCLRDQFGKVTREILEGLPGLKLIVTRSVGTDHVDLAEAKSKTMVDAICDLLLEENLEVAFVARTGNPENIRTIAQHPAQMVG